MIHLRVLRTEDLPQLAEIESSCSKNPWGFHMLEEAMGMKGVWGWGLEELEELADERGCSGRELLGFALFLEVVDELQVLTLCILAEHRRRGLGRMLMQEAKHVAKQLKFHKISLEVRQSNIPALRLYAQMGFVRVGARKAYYRDGEDAILMDCLLNEARGVDEVT